MTYCRSSSASSSDAQDCGDGQKYEEIEKDKGSESLNSPQSVTSVKVKFSELRSSTKDKPKTFNFQTVIHRASGENSSKPDPNTFDSNKSKFEFLFKEEESMSSSHQRNAKDKVPNFSLVGV